MRHIYFTPSERQSWDSTEDSDAADHRARAAEQAAIRRAQDLANATGHVVQVHYPRESGYAPADVYPRDRDGCVRSGIR